MLRKSIRCMLWEGEPIERFSLMLAPADIHNLLKELDSRLCGNDKIGMVLSLGSHAPFCIVLLNTLLNALCDSHAFNTGDVGHVCLRLQTCQLGLEARFQTWW